MKLLLPAATTAALLGLTLATAQQPAPTAAPKKAPPGASLDERRGASRVSWRTRTLVGNDRLLNWKTGPAAAAFQGAFLDAVAQADALGLATIEASARNLPATADITKTKDALKNAAVAIGGYRVDTIDPDRRLFDFAKAIGADLLIGSAAPGALAAIDKLATETKVRVAFVSRNPKADVAALAGASRQIGLAAEAASLTADALPAVKDRLFAVEIRRAAGLAPLFNEMNRLEIRPLLLTLSTATAAEVDTFEKSVQPALAAFVDKATKNMPIRSGDTLPADVKAKIDAAIPRTAYAKPKKPRKLLVIDACVANMSHNTIPHFNLAIALMAKHTGAFEAVFDNNVDNLKWPKIKEWDAIYLNDTVGELFPDPAVRESVLRYVKEGGGFGGWHGSPWVSRSWREIGDMVGAMDAPHRIEPAHIQLDDARSPINQAFDGAGLEHTEEFYRFHHAGPTAFYSRDNLHVLLSLDLAKSPAYHKPDRNGQPFYTRPDGDIAVAWIRQYGKGRVYYNSMGHMPETMMSKPIMGHVFAAIQYILGDLDADDTPSAKLKK